MRVENVRVQNFRCVRDSGDIPLSNDLTVFVGENESGKSAILDALYCFNLGQEFSTADMSTMSPTRESVLSGLISRDTLDMVTIDLQLSDHERTQLNIPGHILPGNILTVTKRLDNSYVLKGANGTPLLELYSVSMTRRLIGEIRVIRRQLGAVFEGKIARKLPQDTFVFIARGEEQQSEDLILFQDAAGDLWDELQQGDIVQVTHQAPGLYGRSDRAMNVGKKVDLDSELDSLEAAASSGSADLAASIDSLLLEIQNMPSNHPLRSIFSDEFTNTLHDQLASTEATVPWNDSTILSGIPSFERGLVSSLEDKLTMSSDDPDSVQVGDSQALQALIDEVGLVPTEAVTADHTERARIFNEKSAQLSALFSDSWVRNVQAEIVPFNQDKEIGLAISCQGSLDPPSRRSQGFNSYLGLTARLLDIGRRSRSRDVVLLLDDPAMHLHPIAQEKLAIKLAEQPFQILAATHFPFMIRHNRLDQVRYMHRTLAGAYFEDDWSKAGDGLLPVRGALSKWTTGRIPLLVEGPNDRDALLELARILKLKGAESLSPLIEPLPSGGSTMPEAAKALLAMEVKFIALIDEDKQGTDNRRKLTKELQISEDRVVSIADAVKDHSNPRIEDVFSRTIQESSIWVSQGLPGTIGSLANGRMDLDQESAENANRLMAAINMALELALSE